MTHISVSQVYAAEPARKRLGRRAGYAAAVLFSLAVWTVVGLLVRGLG